MKFIFVYLMGLVVLFYGSEAEAGAWNLPKGDGQLISTYHHSTANRAFTDREDLGTDVKFNKTESRIFYEHGLTKDITAVVGAAYQFLSFDGQQSQIDFRDFDKTEIGLRYQIKRREGLALSIQGSYVFGGGPPESILDIGNWKDSFELRGLWGQSKEFENYVLFFDAQGAIRARNTERLEDWRADLTLGWKDKKKSMIFLQAFHTERPSFGRDGFKVPVQRRTKLQASWVYNYKKNRHFQLGYGFTPTGRNIVKERYWNIATWISY